jgi:hypothetical protein
LISDVMLNASSTGYPPSMSEALPVVSRNITITSDARGPRMVLDCALLADRIQVAPNVAVLVTHIVLANCSIGAQKPLSFLRFNQGSQLVVQDSFLLQPTDLCLPHQLQLAALPSEPRPASAPGSTQQIVLGNATAWCALGPGFEPLIGSGNASLVVGPTVGAQDNSSYSRLQQVPGRPGQDLLFAATLSQPSRTAFYNHPT